MRFLGSNFSVAHPGLGAVYTDYISLDATLARKTEVQQDFQCSAPFHLKGVKKQLFERSLFVCEKILWVNS